MKERRVRGWIFTIFENVEDNRDIDSIYAKLFVKTKNNTKGTWIIVGKEECPTTGRRHLQGAVHFKNGKTRTAVQKWTGGGKHFSEPMRGSPKANEEYCGKGGEFFEHGDKPEQGKRNDIVEVRECLEDGGNIREVIMTTTNLQGIQYAKNWLTNCERVRNHETEVYWFWGDTESGKSKVAALSYKGAFWANDTNKWWDGYDGHETVIIDDMRGNFCMFNEFLRLIDRNPYRIEVKGGYRQLLAKTFIITCSKHPEKVWNVQGENKNQLMRRIKKIIYFEKNKNYKIKNWCLIHRSKLHISL